MLVSRRPASLCGKQAPLHFKLLWLSVSGCPAMWIPLPQLKCFLSTLNWRSCPALVRHWPTEEDAWENLSQHTRAVSGTSPQSQMYSKRTSEIKGDFVQVLENSISHSPVSSSTSQKRRVCSSCFPLPTPESPRVLSVLLSLQCASVTVDSAAWYGLVSFSNKVFFNFFLLDVNLFKMGSS